VPVLYGPCPKNSDTAINILIDVVQDQSGKQYKMDDYAIRYPTNVLDIADFLVRLTAVQQKLPPILHYSSEEKYTKYEICTVLSGILGLPSSHIIADRTEPPPDLAVSRPKNCQLSTKIITSSIEEAGLGMGFQCRKLEKWFTTYLTQSTT
jgi:S-adenosylmethionine synthetase